jgi:MFS family permease
LAIPLNRNLSILILCQGVATGAAVLVVTMGGIVGGALAPSAIWATVPLSLMVVGTAVSVIPAAMLMRHIGRRRGFVASSLGAAGAALLGALALWQQSFAAFCACTFLIGAKVAFSQQYRFAAAESVEAPRAGAAISLVLVGAVGGALIGPAMVTHGAGLLDGVEFGGSFLLLAVLFLAVALLLLGLREPVAAAEPEVSPERRPLAVIARQPVFLIAVFAGVVAQGVMTFIMTATPIAMHVLDGFTLEQTSGVIRAHVLAMYVPSLISALLIGSLGISRLMALGLGAFAATLCIALQGHEYLHYWFSLLLLGIGWNFLFVGGTSLLLQSYRPEERFTAQATNDFVVFGVAALASLLAGSVVHLAGWNAVLWGSLPLVALMAAALVRLAVLQRREAAAAMHCGTPL